MKFHYRDGYFVLSYGVLGGIHAHRLRWMIHYNRPIPDNYEIHHINGDKTDNRIQNLICVPKIIHAKFHGKHRNMEHAIKNLKPDYWKGKHRSEKTKKKISIALKGDKSPFWKPYARIAKSGLNKQGKQEYCIMKEGRKIKRSINQSKLLEWFTNSHVNEILVLYTGGGYDDCNITKHYIRKLEEKE